MVDKITKEMNIVEVLTLDRSLVPVFFKHGLHCLGCAMSTGENLEQACAVHGINVDDLVNDLNQQYLGE